MSWLSACFGCTNGKKEKPKKPMAPPPSAQQSVRMPFRSIQNSQNLHNQSNQQNMSKPVNIVPKPIPYKIQSIIQKEQIKIQETTPAFEIRKEFKYNCPICFRYFTRIFLF